MVCDALPKEYVQHDPNARISVGRGIGGTILRGVQPYIKDLSKV